MDFENYCEDCVWRNQYGSTRHVLDHNGEHKAVRSKPFGGSWLCGALGLRCEEKICAPFYFIKKNEVLVRKAQEEFLYNITAEK